MSDISNNKRIAKNTLFLYFRQILIMLVSLYTVRVVLNVLGAEDYGIYNVVAGIVTMFSFLSGAMATASQRFFSYEIGRNDFEKLKKSFSVTFIIYIIIVIIVFFLGETIGLWFINEKLLIPTTRMIAAKWLYQLSLVNFGVTLITTPYMSSIIAHENMEVYAFISIFEVIFKLLIIFFLMYSPFDKLIFYGVLLLIVNFIATAIYRFYCKIKYPETIFKPFWEKEIFESIFKFTGWTLFGALTTIFRTQAITVLLNQFFSPIIAASRAVSMQVANAMNVFSSNFNTSLYAPIIKEYAKNNKENMFNLIFNGCKITFYLMWIFSLPMYFRMDYLIKLWLKFPPENVVVFTKLAIIEVLISSVSLPLSTAARAPGKVGIYELTLGSLQLLIFFGSFIGFQYFNCKSEIVYFIAIYINIIMFFVRLLLVNKLIKLSIFSYFNIVIIPLSIIIFISTLFMFFFNKLLNDTFISFILLFINNIIISSILFWFIGLDREMKKILKNIFSTRLKGVMHK